MAGVGPTGTGKSQLALDVAVLARRGRIHVQDTLPHLVEQVLAETAAPLEHRLELGWLRITHECRHLVIKATAGPGLRIGIAHGSPVAPSGGSKVRRYICSDMTNAAMFSNMGTSMCWPAPLLLR